MSQFLHCQKHILSDKRWKSPDNLQQITNNSVWHMWLPKFRTCVCRSSPRASISWTNLFNLITFKNSSQSSNISPLLIITSALFSPSRKNWLWIQKTNFIYIYFHFAFFYCVYARFIVSERLRENDCLHVTKCLTNV